MECVCFICRSKYTKMISHSRETSIEMKHLSFKIYKISKKNSIYLSFLPHIVSLVELSFVWSMCVL